MKLIFATQGWADYLHWQRTDLKMTGRINALLQDISCSPFHGIGKPEPLRRNWAGYWARRIDGEHRLIYRIMGTGDDRQIEIAQCRFHYDG